MKRGKGIVSEVVELSVLMLVVIMCGGCTADDDDTINGYEYVDLGLSVKWATYNVGAESPADYGDNYYAWGETKTKESYDNDNCETMEKELSDIGGTDRDVAHVEWGGSWRMPTKAEMDELIENCKWHKTAIGGRKIFGITIWGGAKGYRVKSKKNGKSIFLPAAGVKHGTLLYYVGKYGSYWCSTPDESDTRRAYSLDFNSDCHNRYRSNRLCGRSIRPVSE